MADRRTLGSLATNPDLDRWVTFHPEMVIVRTGKAELGQGIRSAIQVIAADELGVDAGLVVVLGPSTGSAPNEWVTAGSGSIEQSGTAVRQACAQARERLLDRAAERFGVDRSSLVLDNGAVVAPDGSRANYADLAKGGLGPAGDVAPTKLRRQWVGKGVPRSDLAKKMSGQGGFVHDLALDGMRHARVIRPPRPGATLAEVPDAEGFEIVRRGSFLAVVADKEADAVRAADRVRASTRWTGGDPVPPGRDDPDWLIENASSSRAIVDGAATDQAAAPPLEHDAAHTVVKARYSKPFILHGSIGPSAAVAQVEDGHLTVWSHSQGVELLRPALADLLGLPADDITVHHVDGAGCYGHNGADDAAADAALVATALPGRPISLKWTRRDEHLWEPAAPAMTVGMEAGVDASARIATWSHDVYSYSHGARPRAMGPTASGFLASWYLDPPFEHPKPQPGGGFHSAGHRNADPLYEIPTKRIAHHFVKESPIRTSSTRGLGAYANVFAIESFVDECAHAVGADPVEFRLAHLKDQRARAVIEAVVELAGGLEAPGGVDAPGRGIAFARYENVKTYVAVIAEAEVSARTGEITLLRAWIAADAGEVIDPDGLTNQLEGGLVQAASWTMKERVDFGEGGLASTDWESYPILRFSECPEVTTRLIDRPDERPLGAGEASTGPTPAAIANAVFQATGARVRDLPMRPDRVRAALQALL